METVDWVMLLVFVPIYWSLIMRLITAAISDGRLHSVRWWEKSVLPYPLVRRLDDRRNPRYPEIHEHQLALRGLKGKKGDAVSEERKRLRHGLEQLRDEPLRRQQAYGSAFVEAMQPYYDSIHQARQAGDAIITRQQKQLG